MLMYIFAYFKVFASIMLFVNFTSLQFFKCFFAVFYSCLKHLDDETHSHYNSFRLNPFSHAVVSEIVMKINQL